MIKIVYYNVAIKPGELAEITVPTAASAAAVIRHVEAIEGLYPARIVLSEWEQRRDLAQLNVKLSDWEVVIELTIPKTDRRRKGNR